jgi:hypothetical protein
VTELTTEQQAIFDAEIESLRERLGRRRAIMALPSLKQRADALKRLRVAIESVRRAAAAKPLQVAGLFSPQTESWFADAQAVADELRERTKLPRNRVLARGMARPNECRAWLIGEEIPALYELVFDGAPLPVTVAGENARGKHGMSFIRRVLVALGEDDAQDETFKSFVSGARRRVRAGKTRSSSHRERRRSGEHIGDTRT